MNPRTSSSSTARGGAAQRTVLRSAAVLAPVVQQQRQRSPESQPLEQTIGHAHGITSLTLPLPRQARQAPVVQGPWNAAAEVHMDELERLSRQLLQNLQELNSATDAEEDSLPELLPPAVPVTLPSRARRSSSPSNKHPSPVNSISNIVSASTGTSTGTSASTSTSTSAPTVQSPARASPAAPGRTQRRAQPARKGTASGVATAGLGATRSTEAQSVVSSGAQLEAQSMTQSGAQSELHSGAHLGAQSGFRVGTGPSIPVPSSARVRRATTGGVERRAATSGSGTVAAATAASYDKGLLARTEQLRGRYHQLLSPQVEAELVALAQDGIRLERLGLELRRIQGRPPSMQQWAKAACMDSASLFTARLAAGRAARSTLVAHNMRLVYRMAMLFSGRGISMQDLVVAGVRGVLRSMETFETRKGCRFCTYATFWVRAMLQRLLIEGFTVRLTTRAVEHAKTVANAYVALAGELRRVPSTAEVAQRVRMSGAMVESLVLSIRRGKSLDMTFGDGDEEGGAAGLPDHRPMPDEVLERDLLRRDVHTMLGQLPDKYSRVLRLRYGEQAMTGRALAEQMGVTSARVFQVEQEALRCMRGLDTESGREWVEQAGGAAVPARRTFGGKRQRG